MVAYSRPSLRSSSHRNTTHADPSVNATVDTSKPSPIITRPAKRAHDHVSGSRGLHLVKKQKFDTDFVSRPRIAARKYLAKSISPTKKPSATLPTTSSVNSQIATAYQPPANGTIVPNDTSNTKNGSSICESTRARAVKDSKKAAGEVDKRTLRSQNGGSRSKSELSLYFPNYEELIGNKPKEIELLTPQTCLFITDDDQIPSPQPSRKNSDRNLNMRSPTSTMINGCSQTANSSTLHPNTTTDIQIVDFSTLPRLAVRPKTDPLSDDVYFKAHRRAERQEKQLRNIEKERAQHEKVQLERLLEGLKGHDWLRTLGISGITDSEKKEYEPKREFFIQEVRCLIEKFRRWKEEEKRRKVEKEASIQADDDYEDDADEEEEGEGEEEEEEEEEEEDEEEEEEEADAEEEEEEVDEDKQEEEDADDGFHIDDVDTLAALHLHVETLSASKSKPGPKTKLKSTRGQQHHLQPDSPPVPLIPKPFTSFFAKSYVRDAALGKHRRGRTRFAFGHPIPVMEQRWFELPGAMLTDDAIAASARSVRRARRTGRD